MCKLQAWNPWGQVTTFMYHVPLCLISATLFNPEQVIQKEQAHFLLALIISYNLFPSENNLKFLNSFGIFSCKKIQHFLAPPCLYKNAYPQIQTTKIVKGENLLFKGSQCTLQVAILN